MSDEIIIGISGASGVQYGIRLLETLKSMKEFETHLILSESAKQLIKIETDFSIHDIEQLGDNVYGDHDFTAPIASGSHRSRGMIVAPCSMKTLASIAIGMSDTLISRAADVCLKERRPLVLMVRETPLNLVHIENMGRAARAGAHILPASPAFYSRPESLDDIINFMAGRALDLLSIEHDLYKRWK
ncbi:polyprenyl p-hydroxybenzoate/phenylacrylic acid decarboxylase [Candidatus Methanoperedens nitroreducens]|uniref:Flavin prenyltransferase UbiX n=1 Tax=Candidatus Methanoperedens nitratireducens TaxID=1392998 RepID=A0A062V3T3_9EURY|nr:UbiX family flavin prenyltransferase [Candidatus Methanoperedens nitroreducens]KCZ71987.1 polyprenyl p-hydroxybenzoate/phenylacrylic acid decarboxylase [Candidatus Methanoperedens nitroreducens]MDJ1422036.1 UbiX family flavin prenyltransferase [Candidatus Methanoperedens sp.]